MDYLPRIVDTQLTQALGALGAVAIEGPKGCGKTRTARQIAKSEVLLDTDSGSVARAQLDPTAILSGAQPRLIDEWQVVPNIWNHIRRRIDENEDTGQFILTGSTSKSPSSLNHSGAGRMTQILMRPMSLFEMSLSNGEVPLESLWSEGYRVSADKTDLSIADLSEVACVGGWPGNRKKSTTASLRSNEGYLNQIANVEISEVDGRRRDKRKVSRLLYSLARNTATTATISSLATDVSGDDETTNADTVRSYLDSLALLFVVEDQPAWSPNIRSRARVRQAPKRHFVDPSLAAAAMRLTPARLVEDTKFFGFMFESMVVRDLRIYAQHNDATVYHYRDSNHLEVDAIIEKHDGRYLAIEIKLGQNWIDEGASNLLKFTSNISELGGQPPDSLVVVVGTGYGYTRPDGVHVIPIGSLGP